MFSKFPVGTTGTFEVKADGSIDIKATIPGESKKIEDEKSPFGYFRMPYMRYCKDTFETIIQTMCGFDGTQCFVTDSYVYFRGRATETQMKNYKLESVNHAQFRNAQGLASRWPTGTGFPRSFFIDRPSRRSTNGLNAYCVKKGPMTRPLTGPDIMGRFTDSDGFMYFLSPMLGDDLMRRYRFQALRGILTSDYETAQKKCGY